MWHSTRFLSSFLLTTITLMSHLKRTPTSPLDDGEGLDSRAPAPTLSASTEESGLQNERPIVTAGSVPSLAPTSKILARKKMSLSRLLSIPVDVVGEVRVDSISYLICLDLNLSTKIFGTLDVPDLVNISSAGKNLEFFLFHSNASPIWRCVLKRHQAPDRPEDMTPWDWAILLLTTECQVRSCEYQRFCSSAVIQSI